jgi:hypothetical protein
MELVIEPTLEQEIYKGQLKDEKLKKIAEDIVMVSHQDFEWMIMEFCGLERGCVYLRISPLGRESFMKLMSQLILFIRKY